MQNNEPPIKSVREKIFELVDSYLQDKENFRVDLKDLDLNLYVKGETWAGIVDRPLAKFILDLDKRLQNELAAVGVDVPKTPHGLLALQIKEGSLDAAFQYSKGILKAWNKMNPRSQILIIVALCGALGIVSTSEIIDALNKDDIEKIRSEERIELVRAVGEIAKSSKELQQPVKALVKSMDSEDLIKLPGKSSLLKKGQVNETLEASQRSKAKTYYIDHCYVVQELSTKTPGKWTITICYGGVSFRAKLLLAENEVAQLLEDFQEAHRRGSEIAPDLQVTAEISAKGIRTAEVIAIGKPRKNATKLSEALTAQK